MNQIVIWLVTALIASSDESHCGRRWYKVYENDAKGETVFGSISDLRTSVLDGAAIRISTGSYITSVQGASIVDGNVCAEALFHISKAGYDKFQDNAYWCFVDACSTGHWQMARYNVGEHVSRGNNEERQGIQWFVRERCGEQPILEVDASGKVISGSVEDVITAINSAMDIRLVLDQAYSSLADNLEYNAAESMVGAMKIWSVSQREKAVGQTEILDFKTNAYWFFTIMSTTGRRHMSRWNVGDHVSRGDTSNKVSSKWFADPCWKLVYQHDAAGKQTCGSLSGLFNAVISGHKIKLVFSRSSFEADEVFTRNGHVCVTLVNDLSKTRVDTFHTDTHWVWREICSTGTVHTISYKVGSTTNVATTTESERISWFTDVREWRKVLTTAATGSVTYGSKPILVHAVRNGAELRYRTWTDDDEPGTSVVYQADNIAISGDEVGAMHVRSLSTSPSGSSERVFQSNPYWVFTITLTSGRVDRIRWTVGAHTDRGHTNDKVNVEWFVAE